MEKTQGHYTTVEFLGSTSNTLISGYLRETGPEIELEITAEPTATGEGGLWFRSYFRPADILCRQQLELTLTAWVEQRSFHSYTNR
ncbi:hypothetical protein J6590_057100 [Homalodisca vitripennis]|nr:hypothetical protein J6590_057100 [Homalodisca vitripennis]